MFMWWGKIDQKTSIAHYRRVILRRQMKNFNEIVGDEPKQMSSHSDKLEQEIRSLRKVSTDVELHSILDENELLIVVFYKFLSVI